MLKSSIIDAGPGHATLQLMEPGTVLTLDVEKATAGGRMLARHERQVVLLWGAIPGERIHARVERTGKGVVYAETIAVLSASSDRREFQGDWRCGGSVLAHVAYPRQLQLKGEIIADAFGRIGRVPLASPPDVIASPEQGYRMRARLHARGGRIGFFREGSHELCHPGSTGQLLPETTACLADVQEVLQRERLAGVVSVELAENIAADQRACHLELAPGETCSAYGILATSTPLTGLSAQISNRREVEQLAGLPAVVDVLHAREGDPGSALRLRRDVRAFFQGNRFLLERLVRHLVSLVPAGPVVDLYAGVGLFGLAIAAAGGEAITLVEGEPVSGADLEGNAEPFGSRVTVQRRSVEAFLRSVWAGPHGSASSHAVAGLQGKTRSTDATFIVDPPRTGLSKDALGGIVRTSPPKIVYVSCDVATLARDTRALLDAGYSLDGLTGFDLFPNSPHVETVATFVREPSSAHR